jgi:hypothetical protein
MYIVKLARCALILVVGLVVPIGVRASGPVPQIAPTLPPGGNGGGAGESLLPPIYVDPLIGSAHCTTYNVATRSCSGGTESAYKTLAGAAAAATAGQIVYIRAGTYTQALVPQTSGTAAQPITYAAYNGETATITGASLCSAIDISNRSYLVIDGLTVTQVQRWLLAVSANYNVIRNCTFTAALDQYGSSKTGLFFQLSTYNQVIDNVISDSTADNLSLVASDHNLVAGNQITEAAHTLWTIKCGNFNILRDNYFYNSQQKIGEIYDCFEVGVDHDITRSNATKYNVVQDNVFAYTASSGDASPYAGIQYAAQNGIIRRNVFYDTMGPALDLTLYSDEAEYNLDNRVYNNVFYDTHFAGINIAPPGYNFGGQVLKNNILYGSVFLRQDMRWPWYIELDGKPIQVLTGNQSGFVFQGNDICGDQPGQTYTITYGFRDEDINPPQHNLAWWESNHPAQFLDNLDADPGFVNEAARDCHLLATSPAIDAGVYLTQTASGGSGTALRVQDVGYFCDGYGIPGQAGDMIRLQDAAQSAKVVAINYSTNTLTLDRALTWTSGQGVSQNYAGAAPDLGAFEFSSGLPADMNCDGAANAFDIDPFVLAMCNPAAYQAAYPNCNLLNGDTNCDGALNAFDIDPFVLCIVSGCSPCP